MRSLSEEEIKSITTNYGVLRESPEGYALFQLLGTLISARTAPPKYVKIKEGLNDTKRTRIELSVN
ncbi:MAG: hypothetical protein WC686_02850 [Candidatus Shapirobacteria bacterium]